MERNEEVTLPSTSSAGDAVVSESTAASPSTRTTTTSTEGEVVDAADEVTKKVYATEEQIRAVFTNGLVSLLL